MPVITLPDGSQRSFDHPVTVADVAASIGAGLAKAALAGRVDGKLVDTSCLIETDVALAIVTERDAEALDIIRHSTAHLLAMAVQEVFPGAQVTIGPVIEDGFFYDFAYERGGPHETQHDLQMRGCRLGRLLVGGPSDKPLSGGLLDGHFRAISVAQGRAFSLAIFIFLCGGFDTEIGRAAIAVTGDGEVVVINFTTELEGHGLGVSR